jgi:tetratricopeptide (TPR) repeat protein
MWKVKEMKRRGQPYTSGTIDQKLSKLRMGTKLALVLMVFATLCASALAQEETAESWYKQGYDLYHQESYEKSINAFNRSLEIDPQYFDSWLYKGAALKMLAFKFYGQNRIEIFEESLKAYDRAIEIDRNNASAWCSRAMLSTTWPGPPMILTGSIIPFRPSTKPWSWILRMQMPGTQKELL